ncbi:hypothetical protein MVEG_04243 [Podila verticillata NRRL 6337]|nr:hypothetical protein MVEG_04243 [Podila verticillata NRRL 6337]
MMAPGYNGTKHGLTHMGTIAYYVYYFVLTPRGSSTSIYYACPFLRLFTGGNVVSWGSVRVVNVGSMINQYNQHCMRIHVAFQGVPMEMLLIPLNIDFGAHAIRAGLTNALDEVSIQDMTFTPS